jgi:glycosyltransferase involved in cell wall biosynthesis
VIAYGVGGARESVLDGRTGVLFAEQQPDSLAEAIGRFERLQLDEREIRENARRFGRERFQQEMAAAIDLAWRERTGARETGVGVGESS